MDLEHTGANLKLSTSQWMSKIGLRKYNLNKHSRESAAQLTLVIANVKDFDARKPGVFFFSSIPIAMVVFSIRFCLWANLWAVFEAAQALNLNISTSGGNSSSPILYGLLFEVLTFIS